MSTDYSFNLLRKSIEESELRRKICKSGGSMYQRFKVQYKQLQKEEKYELGDILQSTRIHKISDTIANEELRKFLFHVDLPEVIERKKNGKKPILTQNDLLNVSKGIRSPSPSNMNKKRIKKEEKEKNEKIFFREYANILRQSPVLAVGKAIEEAQKTMKKDHIPVLPRIKLHHLKPNVNYSDKVYFTPRDSKSVFKQLQKERESIVNSLKNRKRSRNKFRDAKQLHNMTPRAEFFSERMRRIIRFFRSQRFEMCENLILELKRKDKYRPGQYLNKYNNFIVKKGVKRSQYEEIINFMNKETNLEEEESLREERRLARKLWFNNFVYMVDLCNRFVIV